MTRKLFAEAFGTFWLVFGGCGAAVLAAGIPEVGIGFAGVALAFGLTVLTGAYYLGHISGGHFNPAVTLGLFAAGKADGRDVARYVVAQLVGAVLACAVLAIVANGLDGFDLGDSGFAANGYGDHSPAGFVTEFVLTAVFLMIILGATRASAPLAGGVSAPIAIGLALTLIHLISSPGTNTSVNPARSTGPALVVGDWALEQLWLFWVAPIAGAVAGALLHRYLLDDGGPNPVDPATEDEPALAPQE